jgi:rod shape-determining protein MreC
VPRRFLLWVGGLTIFLGIYYYHARINSTVRWLSSCAAYPFLHAYRYACVYVDDYCVWLISKKHLDARVRELECAYADLLEKVAEQQSITDVCDEIQELQAFRKRYKKYCEARIAPVLVVHQNNDEHYILLEGGACNGVHADMLALYKHHLVGRVVEVFSWYAKVRLTTDRRMHVACYCAKTKAKGICQGAHDEGARIQFIDHLQRVRLNDMVISSGKGLVFPRGLTLGKVVHVVKRDVDYEVVVQPLIDFSSLDYCLLVPTDAR